jgi:hypothetical protein
MGNGSRPGHYLEVSGQLHGPAPLPPPPRGKKSLDRRLCGPQSRSGRYGDFNILEPTGTRTRIPRSAIP